LSGTDAAKIVSFSFCRYERYPAPAVERSRSTVANPVENVLDDVSSAPPATRRKRGFALSRASRFRLPFSTFLVERAVLFFFLCRGAASFQYY